MDTVFINSTNARRESDGRLILDIFNNIGLRNTPAYVLLSNLSIYYTWKNITKERELEQLTATISTAFHLHHRMILES